MTTTTLTKFDALGSCLAELSFDHAQIGMTRNTDGSLWFYSVDLQTRDENEFRHRGSGMADTPTEALEKALADYAKRQAAQVEAAAEIAA